jgi:hypothetical protein
MNLPEDPYHLPDDHHLLLPRPDNDRLHVGVFSLKAYPASVFDDVKRFGWTSTRRGERSPIRGRRRNTTQKYLDNAYN